jgi:hypothetical protein
MAPNLIVNFIGNITPGTGIFHDMTLARFILYKHYRRQIQINTISYINFDAPPAHINVFFENVNYGLLPFAKKNILIPNQEWYYRSWLPYIPSFDEIWVKTRYAERIFGEIPGHPPVKYIGWCSRERNLLGSRNRRACLLLAGRSINKNAQLVADEWRPEYPPLTISINTKENKEFVDPKKANVRVITGDLTDGQVDNLLSNNGIHICLSRIEGFGHSIVEAKMAGAVVVTTGAAPMNELSSRFLVDIRNKFEYEEKLGEYYSINTAHMHEVLAGVFAMSNRDLDAIGRKEREEYDAMRQQFSATLIREFERITGKIGRPGNTPSRLKELPPVSVVTLVYDRPKMFLLACHNIETTNYPRDKIEWIVVDDSSAGKKVGRAMRLFSERHPEVKVRYISLDIKTGIAEKRNRGVEEASNDIILMMDDDDYYPPESIETRVTWLGDKPCAASTTIGCFHIGKYISMVNNPPHRLGLSERISEATLTFRKKFWEEGKFIDDMAEGDKFIRGRELQVREIPWKGVIVALQHKRNASSRRAPEEQPPNGSHYGWSNELFSFLVGLYYD